MKYSKISAKLSLGICIFSSAALIALVFTFRSFFTWFYGTYHDIAADTMLPGILKLMTAAFYCCVPFAAAALYMLIRLLLNVIGDRVFVKQNVSYFRFISWCCYTVTLITLIFGLKYNLLLIITFAMAVVGTLLRVVKNIMQSAVEISEENDLTI